MLISAIVLINAALVFYSIGVWAERIRRRLHWWHAGFFALGFACDLSGTLLMTALASSGSTGGAGLGAVLTAVMAVTGTIALALMALHLAWAVVALVRNRPGELQRFHRFSIVVWSIWLVPFLAGAIASAAR
jgi:uncharacterized repeat protein (TIGR03987 family)